MEPEERTNFAYKHWKIFLREGDNLDRSGKKSSNAAENENGTEGGSNRKQAGKHGSVGFWEVVNSLVWQDCIIGAPGKREGEEGRLGLDHVPKGFV